MAISRKEVRDVLMRAGLPDLAAKVDSELPDPVGEHDLDRFRRRHGLSRDYLVSRMGGSP